MGKFKEWLSHAWDAFTGRDSESYSDIGPGSYSKPDRIRISRGNERSILNAALNRIALDCASVKIRHVRLDEDDRMVEVMKSSINKRLTIEANLDQTGRTFLQNVYMDILDKGTCAAIPVRTDFNPSRTDAYKILELRTGEIKQWYPKHVLAKVYDQETGKYSEIKVEKKYTAIIENPMYAIMNDTNSTFQRLMRKLSLLDIVDEQSGSGKLDMIIQLPYTIKSETRRQEAKRRRDDLEDQIKNTKLGIAYTDATEKIIQLNKPLENNLLKQIEYLTNLFYTQLGITAEIMNGTADETAMNNYYNRTIEPLVSAVADEFHRKFLTNTARTQLQAIKFYRDPFKLLPVNSIAEIADKFTRNEIMTANEIRQIIGMRPSLDPKSDQLRNANIAEANGNGDGTTDPNNPSQELADLDASDKALDDIEAEMRHSGVLMHYASKYYDPVKAHEYYERTKQLKGDGEKKVTEAQLEEKGKEAATYVRKSMNEERDAKIGNIKSQTKKDSASETKAMKLKIQSLRDYVKQLSPERKKEEQERLVKMVKQLRNQSARTRQELRLNSNNSINSIREDYANKYEAEMKKLGNEYGKGSGSSSSGSMRYKKRFWR